MMRRMTSMIAVALLVSFTSVFANDFVSLSGSPIKAAEYHDHSSYESWFSTETMTPVAVVWDLSVDEAIRSDVASNRWKGNFAKCGSSATHSDYTNSGYDRGHMCPNNDRDYDAAEAKATFRMCNVCPQTPKLNRGSWKKYESYGHRLAARYEFVTIVCGPIYYENKSYTYIGSKNNKIAVPDAFYKIFIADNEFVEAYVFKQDGSYEEATIDMIVSLTSIGFSLTK